MINFLQDFYEMRYSKEIEERTIGMETIKSMTSMDEWLRYAKTNSCYCFQFDEFVHIDTPYPGGWTHSLEASAEQIILSLDGKIIMECYGELFKFFTKLIKERLSKYKLAESLMVAISG